MEDLITTQYQLIQSIENIFINFNKDGPERRTFSTIQRRLSTLEAYWNEFQNNHSQIIDYQDTEHEYFKRNYYQRTKNYYEQLSEYLQLYLLYKERPESYDKPTKPFLEKIIIVEQTTKPAATSTLKVSTAEAAPSSALREVTAPQPAAGATTPASTQPPAPEARSQHRMEPQEAHHEQKKSRGTSSRLDEMFRKQISNYKAFSRTITSIDFNSLSEKWQFEDVLKNIESRWSTIDSLHWEIDSELYEDDEDNNRNYNAYEREYNEIKQLLNQKKWSASYKTQSTPTMDIPTFNGDYHRWISFKDLFTESIHTNFSMSNAQKMQFLKSKVKGEAEKLINHLNISSDNYQVCWDILNHRYNNVKLIFSSHINILMTLPLMQNQTASLIKKIHDTSNECLNAIKTLGVDISTWDPLIVHILSQKLDSETHKDYIESLKNPRDLPTLAEFFEFLENKFTSLEASKRKQDKDSNINKPTLQYSSFTKKSFQQNNFNKFSANNAYQSKPIPKAFYASSALRCPNCKGKHGIFNCDDFIQMPNEIKLKKVDSLQLCVNCLYNHNGNKCHSTKACSKCNKPHNTLLHDAFNKSPCTTSNKSKETVNVSQNKSSEILLATALIRVLAADGTNHTMRALIDQGSQITLITENAAQKLRLPRRHCSGVVFGLGAQTNNSKGSVEITASAIHGDFTFNTTAIIMKNLINNLPNQSFSKPSWPHIEHISLADPEFYISRPVDLLLGADVYSLIIQGGIIKGDNESQPIAQQTHLGWLLCGNVKTSQYQCNVILNNIDDIQRFWTIEDINSDQLIMSQEDHHCVQLYKQQTTRQADGRYIVRLPMKPNAIEKLGESRPRAIAQFRQLEKKFAKNEALSQGYKSFINEYINLEHMIEADSNGNKKPSYYLPHHCVIRSESTTTALRVVFNASSPTSSGLSLNDIMYSGPNLQQDLLSLILKWRQYQVVFTADIEKMFRQILIHQEDQSLQKIIWRDSAQELLREYNLATVTYGTKAAPFLAMMTLKQLANDEGHKYSSPAKQALEEDFYMDDLVSGSHSISEAKQLQTDLILLLKSGGFNLRKWSSNIPELRRIEGRSAPETNQETFNFKYPESTKTLRLSWNPHEDVFTFQLKLQPTASKLTKRILLSEISKIFDPLGWLSPVTTKLKLLFQKLWQQDIEWNNELPNEIIVEWSDIKEDLEGINHIKVQRWLQSRENYDIELHGFCDSSTKAYACVIYYKVKTKDQFNTEQSSITIAAAKAKIVPIKKAFTLPRLELMSCHLLTQLMEKVVKSLQNHNIKTFGWTDSTAALGWIQGDSDRWKAFVANRVEQIKEIMPPNCWRYVKSAENPADCASRGISVKNLQEHTLWWTGPAWLSSYNPENHEECPTYVNNEEVKKSAQSNVTTVSQDDVIIDIVNKHSDFNQATRVLAWVLRMVSRNRPLSNNAYLSVSELLRAKQLIIKHYQSLEFGNEINNLKAQKSIDSKSKILNLNPFLDQDGLLRVGGRIKHAQIDMEMKHPLIIPHDGHLTNLLIDQAHRNTYHGGARLTLSRLRNNYWVIGGNRAVKKHIRRCVTCKKHNPVKQNQLMGDLPAARSNPTRPFLNTGVDFTGFVDVKTNKGRGVKTTKGYIAVFVCMVTKAVHLELVSDLSSSAFLAALRRMAARRGTPRHVYCDNGTNFVGASRILKQEFINIQATLDNEFFSQVTDMEIEFHFNAPSWPSAGGLWEAAVKSLKHHLRRVIGEQKLTYEEYSTLLSQIEACLNTRPLCAISEDPEDIDFITPSHFLASGPTLTILETERDERTRWQLTQKIFNDVWKRWQNEYLCQISARSKWQQSQNNQKVGDIVIIHDANLPAGKWSLGRVIELHPGKDGRVRVVTLKTKNGIIQRPIVKLSPLLVNNQENAHVQQNIQQDQYINKTTHKTKPNIGSRLKTLAITLLTIMLAVPVQCTYNIAELKPNQSIYFDKISDMHLSRNEWKLVVYYNMDPYWEGSKMLSKYIDNLGNVCRSEKPSLCDAIIVQLRHGVKELDHYDHMLLGQQFADARPRARRGLINGIGNIAHSLFGVLDDQFAEQYQKDIESLKMNEKHMVNLWKNQTSVVEAEHNLLQRIEETMNKQNKIINQHIIQLENMANSMKEKLQHLATSNDFTLSAFIAHSLLLNLRNIQEYLLDTVVDLHYGSFNIHLITPDQLTNELNVISGQLPKDLSLPINSIISDLPKLYHLLKVKAKMTKQFFIFEIRIPLIARDYYEIYRLIPIHHKVENRMFSIKPVSEYIAMNIQKDSFITMKHSDLQACNQYDDSTYLCTLQMPIHHITSDKSLCVKDDVSTQCVTTTMTCLPTWSQLHRTNTHLYSCCEPCGVRIICGSQVTSEQLNGSGIINLSEGCIIKNKEFTIYSHKQLENNLDTKADVLKIEIPSINHIIELELPTIKDTKIQGDEDFLNHTQIKNELKKIGSQIEQLKNADVDNILSNDASSHDITQYVLIHIIIFIIICASIVLIWRRLRKCRKHSVSRPGSDAKARSPLPPVSFAAPPPPPVQGPSAAPRPLRHASSMKISGHRELSNETSSDGNDIELADLRYARLVNKATTPSFPNHFKK